MTNIIHKSKNQTRKRFSGLHIYCHTEVPFLLIFPLFPSVLSTKIGSPVCVLLSFFQSKKYYIERIPKLSLFKGQDKRVTVQYSAWKHQTFGKYEYKGNVWGDMQKKSELRACARTGRHEVAYCLKVQSI